MKNYIVCTTQRSGSGFFCECLSLSRIAGRPSEALLFLEHGEQRLGPRDLELSKLPLADIILRKADQQEGDVKGWKIMWSTMASMVKRFEQESHPGTFMEFVSRTMPHTRFLYLERSNKIAQAISHVMLNKTRISHVRNDSDLQKLQAKRLSVTIENDEIGRFLKQLLRHERQWFDFFERNAITPQRIVYEEFCSDPLLGVSEVLDALNIAYDKDVLAGRLAGLQMKKTRSGFELELARNFLSDLIGEQSAAGASAKDNVMQGP